MVSMQSSKIAEATIGEKIKPFGAHSHTASLLLLNSGDNTQVVSVRTLEVTSISSNYQSS